MTQEPTSATTGAALRPTRKSRGDAIFAGISKSAGVLILAVLAGVALFLIIEAWPAVTASSDEIPEGKSLLDYCIPLVYGTIIAAVLALLIATPVSLGIALFISHYAPKRLAQGLGYIVDLLAAIPSVVYGLWGIVFLAAQLTPAYGWLAEHVGLASVPVGGRSVQYSDLLKQYDYWKNVADREAGRRPAAKQINLSGF